VWQRAGPQLARPQRARRRFVYKPLASMTPACAQAPRIQPQAAWRAGGEVVVMPGLPYTAASGAVSGRAMCRGSLGCRCAMQACRQRAGGRRCPACLSLMSRVAACGLAQALQLAGLFACIRQGLRSGRFACVRSLKDTCMEQHGSVGWLKRHACAPPRASTVERCLQDGVCSGVPAFLGVMARCSHAECTRAGRYSPTCKYRLSCHGMLALLCMLPLLQ